MLYNDPDLVVHRKTGQPSTTQNWLSVPGTEGLLWILVSGALVHAWLLGLVALSVQLLAEEGIAVKLLIL